MAMEGWVKLYLSELSLRDGTLYLDKPLEMGSEMA